MTRQANKNKTIVIIVVVIVLALLVGYFIYSHNKVSIAKVENFDKDVELARIQANKELKEKNQELEKQKSDNLTRVLEKGVDQYGNVAGKAVGVVGNVVGQATKV